MKKIFSIFFAVTFLSSLYTHAQGTNKYCFMCHSQPTLSIKDSTFGIIKDFYVDSAAYYDSHHGDLECTDCHSEDFADFPHSPAALKEYLTCLECHEKEYLVVKGIKYNKITSELKQSVHYEAMGHKSDCSFCHDPHTIKLKESPLWKIRDTYPIEDQMCVECHDTEYKWFKGGSQRVNLKAIHGTISNDIEKWQGKKCIDCHTKDDAVHNIIYLNGNNYLPKK